MFGTPGPSRAQVEPEEAAVWATARRALPQRIPPHLPVSPERKPNHVNRLAPRTFKIIILLEK